MRLWAWPTFADDDKWQSSLNGIKWALNNSASRCCRLCVADTCAVRCGRAMLAATSIRPN